MTQVLANIGSIIYAPDNIRAIEHVRQINTMTKFFPNK